MDLAAVLHQVVKIEGESSAMKIVKYIPGEILIVEINSRSRPGVTHFLSTVVDEQGLTDMTCSCESFEFRQTCHHVGDALNRLGKALDWLDETLSAWKDALSIREKGGR